MRKVASIRKKISKFTVIGLAGLLLFFAAAIVVNGFWQKQKSFEKVESELLATSEVQAKRILETLLLPEERSALSKILDQIKTQEKLAAISVSQFGVNQDVVNTSCDAVSSVSFICSQVSDGQARTLTRIEHSGKLVAELSKSKMVPRQSLISLSDPHLWILVFAVFMIGGLMLSVLNFIQKELCDSVQEIVKAMEKGQQSRKQVVKKQNYRELRHLARALYGLQSQVEQKSLKESLGEMSRQVAHDMRSPLSLLKVVTADSEHSMTSSEQRLAAQAVKRLEQISSRLLDSDKKDQVGFDTTELGAMIEGLIDEKSHHEKGRVDFLFDNSIKNSIQLSSDSETVLRTLSNLIDNSVEATEGHVQATVRISLSQDENEDIVIDILDTGVGFKNNKIPSESSKLYGHGLGVKAARKDLASQNGSLAYNSVAGVGTSTRIKVV